MSRRGRLYQWQYRDPSLAFIEAFVRWQATGSMLIRRSRPWPSRQISGFRLVGSERIAGRKILLLQRPVRHQHISSR